MKRLILSLAFLFVSVSLFAQEPLVKFYLNDGSLKLFNISEIDNISVLTGSNNFNMNIYEKGDKLSSFPTKDIESIKFESDVSNHQVLNIYISGKPKSYKLLDIDSITFTSYEEPSPQIISLNPNSGKIGDEITIIGMNFGDTQGTGFVSFNSSNASNYISWSNTEIKVKVPPEARSGKLFVTVNGKESNDAEFTIMAPDQPQIIKIIPGKGNIGDIVTITGTNFGSSQGTGIATFNGINASDYISWSETEIKVKIPNGATSGMLSVTANGMKSNEAEFTVLPYISSINPTTGKIGDEISIAGTGFGNNRGGSIISFTGANATDYTSWSSTEIRVKIPKGAETGKVSVIATGNTSNEVDFWVIPNISSINPTTAKCGESVTITGTSFGNSLDTSIVSFSQSSVTDYISWSDTEIKVIIPISAETGKLSVKVNGNKSNEVDFVIIPFIKEVTPTSSITGEPITISGTGFGSLRISSSIVVFNNNVVVDYVSWGTNEIKVIVPVKAESGGLSVTQSGIESNKMEFTVLPNIDSISPKASRIGGVVRLMGSGFGNTIGASIVSFNDINASEITGWNKNEISVKTPAGAVAGKLSVTVNGNKSAEIDYIILSVITDINPTSGKIGDEITINGSSFGTTRGTSIVSFNNITASDYLSWNDSKIIVKVPDLTETGLLTVIINGEKSNGVEFSVIPHITNINPASSRIGDSITITGTGFGSSRGNSRVYFNGIGAAKYGKWSNKEIRVQVPAGAHSGKVTVMVSNTTGNEVDFIVLEEVSIGTQVWTAINLDVDKYRNGDAIPQVTDAAQWTNLTTGAWCYYNNDPGNGTIYGKLYNWYAVNDPRGLAPIGWHVPTDAEWTTLINYLGGESAAGGKLKSTGTVETGDGLWLDPNTGATNESSFSAFPGSYRHPDGTYISLGYFGYWWTASEYDATSVWYRILSSTGANILRTNNIKTYGFSVRCVRD